MTTNAPATSAITVAWVTTPAAHGAASTSRFLAHCRGRHARSSARPVLRGSSIPRAATSCASPVNRRRALCAREVALSELMMVLGYDLEEGTREAARPERQHGYDGSSG